MMKSKFPFFITSLLIHLFLFLVLREVWPNSEEQESKKTPIRLTLRPTKTKQKDMIPKEPEYKGQIVDLPDPIIEETPEKAKYLANKAQKTEMETKTQEYKVNPDVLSDEFSKDEVLKKEDVLDLRIEEHSSGAKVGNEQFKPDRDGNFASLPSKFRLTNKDGFQKPTRSSSTTAQQAGAPNNDLLDEVTAERLRLNAEAYPYAGYMNQIRRMVNFYWTQNLDNADGPFSKMQYQTGVTVVITDSGLIKEITVVSASGSKELDDAVVQAFESTVPLPRPPEALLKGHTELRLPDFIFQVNLSPPVQQYNGIDSRSGVQFPGMLKAPR